MERHHDVLIVGGGHGGAAAAMALRHQGFAGSIAIAGDEPDPPYDRPPLSKDYLAGEKDFERMLFRSRDSWAERQVELLLGTRIAAVDASSRTATTESGDRIAFGDLVWAAGGMPRRLTCPGRDLSGVHTLRSRADADRLRSELPHVRHAVVVGGGYIGLEAAAVLVKLGKQVTLIEAQDRVLARVAGKPLSRFYEAEHRLQGVDLRLSAAVDCMLEEKGRVAAVRLGSGDDLPAELVIVGIGIDAAVAPLLAAGAEAGNGVRVDGQCRTSLPHIYAIGDCAEHSNRFADGALVRLESVQNATDQAAIAARAICGGGDTYSAVPWFWSNQYDLRLQTVGLATGHDELVLRGDPASRSFSLIYLRAGAVAALDCVNATRDYAQGRALVTNRVQADPARLADPTIPLKSLVSEGG